MGEDDGVVTKIEPDSITIQQHYQDYTGQFTTREVVMALKQDASMQKRDGGN
jgi:Tfp pilus assembly protein PilP